MADVETQSLSEKAYQPLKEGELYVPLVPAGAAPPEATWRAVLWGTLLCIVFSVASAYSRSRSGREWRRRFPSRSSPSAWRASTGGAPRCSRT